MQHILNDCMVRRAQMAKRFVQCPLSYQCQSPGVSLWEDKFYEDKCLAWNSASHNIS